MRIGIFSDGYLPSVSGVTTSVEISATEMEKRGHQVTIVAPRYPHYKDRLHRVIWIRSVMIPGLNNFRVATYLPGTSLLLASKLDLDIVHGHAGGPVSMLGWEVARIKRIPYVFTYHTMLNRYTHTFLKGKVIKPKTVEVASRLFANATDYVIAPTAKVEQELLAYGVKKPIGILPTGIDPTIFKVQPSNLLHDMLGLPKTKQFILFVGRLGKEKSIDLAIKAFALTVKKQSHADFVIVGDGLERQSLEKLCVDLGVQDRVHFTGFIDLSQITFAYNDASLLLFCSTSETQGLVVPEAMACGLPTIVSTDKAFDHIVFHKKTGLIASQNTAQSFANQLMWALDHPEAMKEMSVQAKKIMADYSLDKTSDQLEALYELLIKQSSSQDFLSLPPWLRLDRWEKPLG